MLNFPQLNDESLRKFRAQLTSPTDAPTIAAHLLQLLIDNDLGQHRAKGSTTIASRDLGHQAHMDDKMGAKQIDQDKLAKDVEAYRKERERVSQEYLADNKLDKRETRRYDTEEVSNTPNTRI